MKHDTSPDLKKLLASHQDHEEAFIQLINEVSEAYPPDELASTCQNCGSTKELQEVQIEWGVEYLRGSNKWMRFLNLVIAMTGRKGFTRDVLFCSHHTMCRPCLRRMKRRLSIIPVIRGFSFAAAAMLLLPVFFCLIIAIGNPLSENWDESYWRYSMIILAISIAMITGLLVLFRRLTPLTYPPFTPGLHHPSLHVRTVRVRSPENDLWQGGVLTPSYVPLWKANK